MSDVPQNIVERIQKLFNLAAKNSNEHEAQSALNTAQNLLEQYNLSSDMLDSLSQKSGMREKAAIAGGYYDYQQDLWRDVATLNFCIYWHQRYRARLLRRGADGPNWARDRKWAYRHFVVGKKVNVASTIAMANYLEDVATRLTKEKTRGILEHGNSNWANSYKRGIVARICRKLRERRNDALKAEEEKRAQEERSADGASTSFALSLVVYADKETDANIDFIHGDGTSARWAAERIENAAEARRQHEAYTAWAAANPEEAAAEEAKRLAHLRKGRPGRPATGSVDKIDRSAYWAGYDAGKDVSIDQQVNRSSVKGYL